MISTEIFPTFLDTPQGRIFVIHRFPKAVKATTAVVIVPPFAEEMNRSRRMLSLVAEALAGSGYHVVLPDLYGTGDSEGDFSQASWGGWIEQISSCVDNLHIEYGIQRYSMLGVRAGALLLADYLKQAEHRPKRMIFWQAVIDGDVYLKQFLRLRVASDRLAGGAADTQSLLQSLEKGELVEVAGYGLINSVSNGLMAASLQGLNVEHLPSSCWIDMVADEKTEAPLPNRKLVQTWSEQGVIIQHQTVVGESFWNSVDIVELPTLIDKTVAFFNE